MRRTRLSLPALIVASAMVLISCGSSDDNSTPDPGPTPESTTIATTIEAPVFYESPEVVPYCELGVCANFPAQHFESVVTSEDVVANGTYTDHHVLSSQVALRGRDGSEYCGVVTTGCDQVESFFIDVLPVNSVNTAATKVPEEGCTFEATTVTGTPAQLQFCDYDSLPMLDSLIVPTAKYIYVVSGSTTEAPYDMDPVTLEAFFDSVGLKT